MIINPRLPSGNVVFCDDIRWEVNGKVSLMGIYGYDMILFGKPPLILPQLWIRTALQIEPPKKDYGFDLVITVVSPDGEITELQRTPQNIPAAPPEMFDEPLEKDSMQFAEMQLHTRLENIHFNEPSTIKVRIYMGDDEIRIGSLRVAFGERISDEEFEKASD